MIQSEIEEILFDLSYQQMDSDDYLNFFNELSFRPAGEILLLRMDLRLKISPAGRNDSPF